MEPLKWQGKKKKNEIGFQYHEKVFHERTGFIVRTRKSSRDHNKRFDAHKKAFWVITFLMRMRKCSGDGEQTFSVHQKLFSWSLEMFLCSPKNFLM